MNTDGGSCSAHLVDWEGSGRGSLLDLDGRTRLLYQHSGDGGGAYFSECLTGCQTSSPTYSAPVRLGMTNGAPSLRPSLVIAESVLAAAWPSGGGTFAYAECTTGCDLLSSWSFRSLASFGPLHGSAFDLAGLGNLRAVVTKGLIGGDYYFECFDGCAVPAGSWSSFALPNYPGGWGASIDLGIDPGTGLIWRAAAYGSDPLQPESTMMYRECLGDCATPGNWAGGGLNGGLSDGGPGAGLFPAVVLDRNALPRIFFLDPSGGVKVAQCLQRPCTNLSSWPVTLLTMSGDEVTAGRMADGRTFFLVALDGNVSLGVESGAGYALSTVDGCAGPIRGQSPAGAVGAAGKWRVLFATDGGMACHSEP